MARTNLTGTFTGTGQSSSFKPGIGVFQISMLGGAGTVRLEKAHEDAATDWYRVSKNVDGDDASYALTASNAVTLDVYEGSGEWIYRFNCTAYTSGTITYRANQA